MVFHLVRLGVIHAAFFGVFWLLFQFLLLVELRLLYDTLVQLFNSRLGRIRFFLLSRYNTCHINWICNHKL
jgi:hypothetical protein